LQRRIPSYIADGREKLTSQWAKENVMNPPYSQIFSILDHK
jgi:hypothetical protein